MKGHRNITGLFYFKKPYNIMDRCVCVCMCVCVCVYTYVYIRIYNMDTHTLILHTHAYVFPYVQQCIEMLIMHKIKIKTLWDFCLLFSLKITSLNI